MNRFISLSSILLPIGRPLTGGAGALELIASCDWDCEGGARIVPKLLWDGNTGPPGAGGATGGDLEDSIV